MHTKIPLIAVKKYIKFLCFIGTLLLFPLLSHAANGVALNDTGNHAMFTPSASDQSIIYLGELFGSMPPVLAGTGSSIMGQLFKIFNNAALTLGIILAGYTTFVGIMNTAGEGEMLGKNWNAIWIPLRTVAGIALLIPTTGGYCICQTFMMWLLVQGIGVADTLTTTVVDYMYSGQKVFVAGDTQQTTDSNSTYAKYDPMVTSIYQGLSCMQAYLKEYPDVNSLSLPAAIRDNDTSPTKITYHFTAYKPSSNDPTQGVEQSCGYIVVNGVDAKSAPLIEQGFSAIMPSLNAAAFFMVNSAAGSEDNVMQATFNFVGADFLNEVEKTYQSYVTQAENQKLSEDTTGGDNADYEDIKAYGWVSLGGLYWDLAQSYGATGSAGYIGAWDTNQKPYIGANANADSYYPDTVWMYASGDSSPDGWATQFVNDLITTRDSGNTNKNQLEKDFNSGKFSTTGAIESIAMNTLQSMLNKFHEKDKNPMVIAQELGHEITYDIEVVFTTLQVALNAASLVANFTAIASTAFWGSTLGPTIAIAFLNILLTLATTIFPGLFAFMAVMLALGGTLAVVIPFIPILAYFLAVIAWLIATLETIVAAPIVAIGVLHPDGQHPVWGKAEPAVMLIINMFLRPGLLVLGFVAGILLSWISIQFVNLGFENAMVHLLDQNPGAGGKAHAVSGVETMLFIATYVGIILACVNKSFSVIEAIPNTIMRWIGHEGTRFESGSDAMQKIQGSQEGSAQKSADSATRSAEGATQAPEKGMQSGKGIAEARQAKDKEKNQPAPLGGGEKK